MILVTGGTGLLGTHLLYSLVAGGHPVRAMRREASLVENTLRVFCWRGPSGASLFDRIEWVEGDLLDSISLADAMQDITQVFHCAALVSLDARSRRVMQDVNTLGTTNMVNAALDAGVKWFCHVSSIAALGSPDEGSMIDESTPWKTEVRHSDYSMTKFAAEREVWRGMEEGLAAVIINPSIILGPGPREKASCRLFRAIDKGLRFYPPGSNGFVDVRDVVDIMLQLMQAELIGQRFVVSGGNYAYQEVFTQMASLLGKPKPSIEVPAYLFQYLYIFDWLRSIITLKPQDLTRTTARVAVKKAAYDVGKIKQATGIQFRSIDETLSYLKAYCFAQHGACCPE